MILNLKGDIERSYALPFCLIFFPGEKFPEEEEETPETIVVNVELTLNSSESKAKCIIKKGSKISIGEHSYPANKILSDKRGKKISVGGAMIKAGYAFTGYIPEWGMLTGVRPAKMARELFDLGFTDQEAEEFMQNVYLVSPEKSKLTRIVAREGNKYFSSNYNKDCSLYISIPFCPTRCEYCSFVSYSTKNLFSLIPEYLKVLIEDINRVFYLINKYKYRLKTIYIGGGTPTILNENQLEILLSAICAGINNTELKNIEEFTVEAGRPDTITSEKLKILSDFGVSRISVNTQTLNDDILARIGRRHSSEDFFKAYKLAENSSIPIVNVDLIAGLPGESFESFKASIDKVIELAPQNITVHAFSIKKSAEIKQIGTEVFDREGITARNCINYSFEKMLKYGYLPYYMYRQKNTAGNLENVGYALPKTTGYYNIYMMDEIHTIFSAGAGSVTKLISEKNKTIKRIFQPKYPYEYLKKHSLDSDCDIYTEIDSEIEKLYQD